MGKTDPGPWEMSGVIPAGERQVCEVLGGSEAGSEGGSEGGVLLMLSPPLHLSVTRSCEQLATQSKVTSLSCTAARKKE